MRRFVVGLMCCLSVLGMYAQGYAPDVLGDAYESRTFEMADDYEGRVVCTLVRKAPLLEGGKALLYLHGYNDYFFQKALGDSLRAHGYNFYALDLRKYGRSLLPHQDPFYCRHLTEYFADLDTALHTICQEGNREVLLMAHSTGGLIASCYLDSRRGAELPVTGLILNSPFLDWNLGGLMETVVIPVVAWLGRFFPEWTVQGGGGFSQYAASLLKRYKGEWTFNEHWKMTEGHPKRAGWIRAIDEAQQQVREGLSLECPVLVLSSDSSCRETEEWQEAYRSSDIVLDVHDIQRLGTRLGSHVTRDTIVGGIHDLILSRPPVREIAYRKIFDWLSQCSYIL